MITAYMLRNKLLEVVQLSTQDVLPLAPSGWMPISLTMKNVNG